MEKMNYVMEYPKIQTMFKRDSLTKKIIEGEWTLEAFEYLKNNEWIFTEKIDGTNMRIFYDGFGRVELRGRTNNANLQPNIVKAMEHYTSQDMIDKIRSMFDDSAVIIFGEGYGKGVQKNGEQYLPESCSFVGFDIYKATSLEDYGFGISSDGYWLNRTELENVSKELDMPIVPGRAAGTLNEAIGMVKSGIKSLWGDFTAEGLVGTPKCGLYNNFGHRVITKIKHKDFK